MKKVHLSEEKINQLATDISNRLFESHYFKQGAIGGEALTDFSDHVQINKFLLFQVYQVWHLQISRFKHPYFDFENQEIKEKLKQLQNLLSRNIAIKQEDFKPMLKKAVYNNLRLLIDPKGSMENFFFQTRDKIDLDLYSRYAPFFSDFDFVVNSILRYHQKNGMKTIDKDVFSLKMDRVVELFVEKSKQDIDTYRNLRFIQLTNRSIDEILAEDEREAQEREASRQLKKAAEAARLEEEQKAAEALQKETEKSFFDTLAPDTAQVFEISEEESPEKEEKKVEEKRTAQEEVPITLEESSEEEAPVQPEPVAEPVKKVKAAVTPPVKPEIPATPEPEPKKEPKEEPETIASREVPEEIPAMEIPDVRTQADKLREMTGENPNTVLRRVSRTRQEAAKDEKPSVLDRFSDQAEETHAKTVIDVVGKEKKASQEKPKTREIPVEQPEKKPESIKVEKEPEKTSEVSEKKASSVLDRYRKEKSAEEKAPEQPSAPKTIADKLRNESGQEGSASPANGKKIKPDEIPIHKQYQYVQKVFGGNNVRFRIIVDKVNNSHDKEELEDILTKFVFNNEDVNENDPVVQEFANLLRSRF